MPIDTATIAYELQCVVASVKKRPTCNKTAFKYAEKYCRTVMKQVNVSEDAHDKKKKKSITRFIKVSSLSNNRYKQSGTMLDWIMFHKIVHMYRDIKKQETVQ